MSTDLNSIRYCSHVSNMDYVRIYGQGRKDGEKAVLGMIEMVLNEGKAGKWADLATYYKASLETLLEVYNYGKEKEKQHSVSQETKAAL